MHVCHGWHKTDSTWRPQARLEILVQLALQSAMRLRRGEGVDDIDRGGEEHRVSRVSLRDRDGLAGPLDRRSTFALFRLLE